MHCLDKSDQMLNLSLTTVHMEEYLKQYKKYVSKYLHDYWYYGITNIIGKIKLASGNQIKNIFYSR